MITAKELARLLSEHGIKPTPQRIAVMRALMGSHQHPTADELYRKVIRTIPGLSQATVYNTLEALVEKGLVRRVQTESGSMRYDAVTGHHHHLVEAGSDRIEDYFDPELDHILADHFKQKSISGFTVDRIQLSLVGAFSDPVKARKKSE